MNRRNRIYVYAGCLALPMLFSMGSAAPAAETEPDNPSVMEFEVQMEMARGMDTSHVADASDMTTVEELDNSSEAVTASMLKDGCYEIDVESSSSMFKIVAAELTVDNGSMKADLILDGQGYLFLYPGTAAEAAEADAEDFLYYCENDEGKYVYPDFPLAALDVGTDCAAFSRKKEQWYPRTLVFHSDRLPADAYAEPAGTALEELGLADGSYEAELSLEGEGRLQLISPMQLEVSDGEAQGFLVFDSTKYDYILIDGVRYDAEEGEEKSSFLIPVKEFDRAIAMVADSTAIAGMNVEQDYMLTIEAPQELEMERGSRGASETESEADG